MSAAPVPVPVTQVDESIAVAIRSVHRARWIFLSAVIAALVIATGFLSALAWQQHAQLQASCRFWSLLAPLPVTTPAGGAPPPKLGVLLIADSRGAFAGQDCGTLPPAAPSLERWASFYRITLP